MKLSKEQVMVAKGDGGARQLGAAVGWAAWGDGE